jgi:hypothetical protein
MKTTTRKAFAALTPLVCAAFFITLFLLQPALAQAQWTTPDAQNNISNTNSGNVGVGTTSPNYKFDINSVLDKAQIRFGNSAGDSGGYLYSGGPSHAVMAGGAAYNSGWIAKSLSASMFEASVGSLYFYANNGLSTGSAFTPTARMIINSGGNVGIGTLIPQDRLVTFGNVIAGNITGHTQLYAGFDAQNNVMMEVGYGTATTDIVPLPILALSKNLTNANQGLGSITFVNSSIANGSEKRISAIGTYTDGATNSGSLAFSTSTAGVLTERMRFTSTGRTGIGTTAPAYTFDVVGPGVWLARFKRTEASNGGIIVESPTGFNPNVALAVNGVNKWYLLNNSSNSDTLQFYESTGSSARFTLTQAGTVGIGTATPSASYKLDVQGGTINTSGGLCIAGDCKTSWSSVGGSQWTNGASGVISYAGGSVGVGTPSPVYTLDVNGGTNGFRAKAASASGTDTIATFENNSAIQMIVRANGNVGIGTTSPDSLAKLHLSGSGFFGQDIQTTSNEWTRLRLMTPTRTYGFFLDGGTGGLGAGTLGLHDYTAGAWRMVVDTAGNVGIGNTAPAEKLHVTGNAKVTGNITVDGNINAKYQDVAEWVESSQELAPGTVVVLDSAKSNQVIASTQSYDSRVAGVISLQPGVTLGEAGEGRVLVATTGRVKVKVDATAGPINIGDLLVTSDKEGVAMKSVPVELGGIRIHRPGTLIGKALEPLAEGKGEILVLLSLQ